MWLTRLNSHPINRLTAEWMISRLIGIPSAIARGGHTHFFRRAPIRGNCVSGARGATDRHDPEELFTAHAYSLSTKSPLVSFLIVPWQGETGGVSLQSHFTLPLFLLLLLLSLTPLADIAFVHSFYSSFSASGNCSFHFRFDQKFLENIYQTLSLVSLKLSTLKVNGDRVTQGK